MVNAPACHFRIRIDVGIGIEHFRLPPALADVDSDGDLDSAYVFLKVNLEPLTGSNDAGLPLLPDPYISLSISA